MYSDHGSEACQVDLASAFVALQNYLFQRVASHNRFIDRVGFVCSVIRRDFHSAFWTSELPFALDRSQIDSVRLYRLHIYPLHISILCQESKTFTEQCYTGEYVMFLNRHWGAA